MKKLFRPLYRQFSAGYLSLILFYCTDIETRSQGEKYIVRKHIDRIDPDVIS